MSKNKINLASVRFYFYWTIYCLQTHNWVKAKHKHVSNKGILRTLLQRRRKQYFPSPNYLDFCLAYLNSSLRQLTEYLTPITEIHMSTSSLDVRLCVYLRKPNTGRRFDRTRNGASPNFPAEAFNGMQPTESRPNNGLQMVRTTIEKMKLVNLRMYQVMSFVKQMKTPKVSVPM